MKLRMKRNSVKRAAALTASLMLSLTGLSACGGTAVPAPASASPSAYTGVSDTPSATPEEKVTLRIGWWGNQVRNDGTVKALELFTEQYPNITFQTEFADWNGYWDKMATQAASNNLPDIIQQDYVYITQYQSKNLLSDLSSLAESGSLSLEDISESILASGTINNRLYALPCGMNAPVFIYNKDIADKAGITVPEHPTYDEIMELSKTVYEKTGILGDIGMSEGLFALVARDYSEKLYDTAQNKMGLSRDNALKVFKMIEDLEAQEWQISPELSAEKNAGGIEGSAIATGSTWFVLGYFSNQLAAYQAATESQLALAMPLKMADAKSESVYLKPSMFWCISDNSQYKEQSAKFLDFFTHSTEAQDILMAERGVPVSEKVADYIKSSLNETQQQVFDYVARVSQVAAPIDPPSPTGANEIIKLITTLGEEMHYGDLSYEAATDRLLQEGEEILTRAAAQ